MVDGVSWCRKSLQTKAINNQRSRMRSNMQM
jgi:hypothetical protein